MVTEAKKVKVELIFSEIEAGIRRLVEENARLRSQISELSQSKGDLFLREKILSLEEEVKKFRKIMEEYQKQEMINRDRIFHLRKLIQVEFDRKTGSVKENILKEGIKDSLDPLPERGAKWKDEEAVVGYSPYIATDGDEPITHWPLESEEEKETPVFSRENKRIDESASIDKEEKAKYPQDPNKVYREKSEIPAEENPHSFMINDFTQEKDPFGDEDSKMEDDDFFKSRSS